jgi:hypothetical protein
MTGCEKNAIKKVFKHLKDNCISGVDFRYTLGDKPMNDDDPFYAFLRQIRIKLALLNLDRPLRFC